MDLNDVKIHCSWYYSLNLLNVDLDTNLRGLFQSPTGEGCLRLMVLPSIHIDTLEILSVLIKA